MSKRHSRRLLIYLALFAGTVVGNCALAILPDSVERIRREDVGHAFYYFQKKPQTCGFALAAADPAYPYYLKLFPNQESGIFVRTAHLSPQMAIDLRKQAGRIRDESMGPDALELLRLIRETGEVPPRAVFSDAVIDGDSDEGESLFREPFAPPVAKDIAATSQDFQKLFYYLKYNRAAETIPSFLLNHGYFARPRALLEFFVPVENQLLYRFGDGELAFTPRPYRSHDLFFCDGFFCGAEISFRELIDFEHELLRSPTLKHLSVRLSLAQLIPLSRSPVLQGLKSLQLTFIDHADEPNRIPPNWKVTTDTFASLRRLAIRSETDAEQGAITTNLLSYFPAQRLDHLELHDVYPSQPHFFAHLRRLKSIALFDHGRLENDRDDAHNFFGSLDPNLESITISDSHGLRFVNGLLVNGPIFTGLSHLNVETTRPIRAVEWGHLADRPSLWKNLVTLSVTDHEPEMMPERTTRYDQIKRVLRQTTRLASLDLAIQPPDDSLVPTILEGVEPLTFDLTFRRGE